MKEGGGVLLGSVLVAAVLLLVVLGVLVSLAGAVWALQGAGFLLGK